MKAFFKSIERPSWGRITAIVGSYLWEFGYIVSFQNLPDFSLLLTDDRLNWRQISKSFCFIKRCGHDLGRPLRHVL